MSETKAQERSTIERPDIDAEAFYAVTVSNGFTFERLRFGPLAQAEIVGSTLELLLASEHAEAVTEYRQTV